MQGETKIEELTDNIKEYLNIRYELATLKASGKASNLMAGLIFWLIVSTIAFLSILLLSFAAACYISAARGDAYSGFLIVGGIYVIIGVMMSICKKSILKPFRNKMIREILKKVEA